MARQIGNNLKGTLQDLLAEGESILMMVDSLICINMDPIYEALPKTADTYSEEICAILGNPLLGTRTTIGVASLPGHRH